MLKPLNEYLELLKARYNYTEEELVSVKEFRENPEVEHLNYDMYKVLLQQYVFKKTRRLSKPRNLFVLDGKVYYLCHFHKRYNFCAVFMPEDEAEELRAKDAELAQKQLEKQERKIQHLQQQQKKREEKKLKENKKSAPTVKKPTERFSFREISKDKVEEVKPKRKRIGK